MNILYRADVQPARRLNGDEELRLLVELSGDDGFLLVAAGHASRNRDRALTGTHVVLLDEPVGISADSGALQEAALAGELRLKVALKDHVVFKRVVEHKAVLVPVLRNVAHAQKRALADGKMRDIVAAELDVSGLHRLKSGDAVDELGLAVAVNTGDADDLARVHVERHTLDGVVVVHLGGDGHLLDAEHNVAGLGLVLMYDEFDVAADHHAAEFFFGRVLDVDGADAFALAQNGDSVRDGHDPVLFTEDCYEEYICGFKDRPTVVKALCLHIAHDCNLACRYCFAEEGEYKGRRALMSAEVGKKALDFLVENSGNRRNLEVDFFGGEPLMNFDVVKEIVAYGRDLEKTHDKKFRFTLTTNGVLLNDDIMEFANKEMDNVVLSVDGRKEVHDFMRPFRNGKGSYDFIIDKFKKFADSRNQQKYYVRGTFTHHNLDFSKDVMHLADEGFEQISVEPVVAPDTADYAIKEEDLPKIMEEYDLLAKEMIKREKEGKGFTFFHFMIDLTGGPCVAKRLSGCGSGTEYLAVTPWGDLYPCHQFVGEEDFLMGNVFEGIKKDEIVKEFKACNVYSKEECKKCFARFYCSGGCSANSYNFNGTINGTYEIGCKLERKRVECALMVKAALALEEETENEEA